MYDTFFLKEKKRKYTGFYLKLLQAKPPLFIPAFQGSLPSPGTHKNQSWAAAHPSHEGGWAVSSVCSASWQEPCSVQLRQFVSVISEQKTLSCHSPFTLLIWDENKFIQNRKHSFSNSSSKSKLSLFIDSQVSWNDEHKLTSETKSEYTLLIMLPVWPFWHIFFKKSSNWNYDLQ